jgi:hypothetical protein
MTTIQRRYAVLVAPILLVAGVFAFYVWWEGLVTYCPPPADPSIGNSKYFSYGEVTSHEDRTIAEVKTSEIDPTPQEWKEGFLAFMDTGILYPFQRHWRPFLNKHPGTQLPYIELRLKTRNTSGALVDVAACTVISFDWISEEIDFDQANLEAEQEQIPVTLSSEAWRVTPFVTAIKKEEQQKIMAERKVALVSRYDAPYGVKRIRIPVLSGKMDHYMPELSRKLKEEAGRNFYAFRAGEWYRVKMWIRNEDLKGQYRNRYQEYRDQNGEWLFAYFKAPPPDVVKPGQILPVDLLVVPYLFPPFYPTSGYERAQIEKGEHIRPMPSVKIPRRRAFKEGIMQHCK